MFSFEGDFRRRPEQSLRGSSKKEPTSELLKRNQEQRLKREEHRQHISSSIVIQAYFRSYRVRQTQKILQRHLFDASIVARCSVEELLELMHKLIFFYQSTEDNSRLLSLSKLLMKARQDVVCALTNKGDVWRYRMERILSLCCSYLQTISGRTEAVSVPLRMLEIFTDESTYTDASTPHNQVDGISAAILVYLVENGYFSQLRSLLEGRIPGDLVRTERAPTPLGGSVFALIIRPLISRHVMDNESARTRVLRRFTVDILCDTYTNQIHNYLLPALLSNQRHLVADHLLDAILDDTSANTDFTYENLELSVPATPWLLYSILNIVSRTSEKLSHQHLMKYLFILQILMRTLPQSRRPAADEGDDSDAESDDGLLMETEVPDTLSLSAVREGCLRCLESADHIRCIADAVSSDQRPLVVIAVCTICHQLIVQQRISVHQSKLLDALAFNGTFIRHVWSICTSMTNTTVTGERTPLLQLISRGIPMSLRDTQRITPVLSIFAALFSTSILSLHDAEFFARDTNGATSKQRMPFSLHELVPISLALRDVCLGIIDLAYPDIRPVLTDQYKKVFRDIGVSDQRLTKADLDEQTRTWAHLFKVTVLLVKQLYARDTRRQFCPNNHWLSLRVNILADKQIYRHGNVVFVRKKFGELSELSRAGGSSHDVEETPPLSTSDVRSLTLLTELPFVVAFQERVKILRRLLYKDREENQSGLSEFGQGPIINISVRRNYIYEDAFEKLSRENEPNLKLKMRVQLKNVAGLDEAGIDGGGLFREFLLQLIKSAFDPNRGFFKTTVDETLYPNPHAKLLQPTYLSHYFFMGRILGKALYENMLIELPLADFFVSKILSRHSGDVDINHLSSLDPEMYRNLLSMNQYEGDVADLALDFTVVNDVLGETKVEELIPGGSNIPVTNANRSLYIHRVADYRLNKQIRMQCHAFREGLADVINLEWLRMFDQHELLVLISGAEVPVDVNDLKRNTNYSGGYNQEHPIIQLFWEIVESFTETQKRLLLKFVTSCSRPPLLGFKELYPAFCIHYGGNEPDRLPTASTCMNLLKLPEFKDAQTLKQKLVYAIESESGFELS